MEGGTIQTRLTCYYIILRAGSPQRHNCLPLMSASVAWPSAQVIEMCAMVCQSSPPQGTQNGFFFSFGGRSSFLQYALSRHLFFFLSSTLKRTELMAFVQFCFPPLWACVVTQLSVTWLHRILFYRPLLGERQLQVVESFSLRSTLTMYAPQLIPAHSLLSAASCCGFLLLSFP